MKGYLKQCHTQIRAKTTKNTFLSIKFERIDTNKFFHRIL